MAYNSKIIIDSVIKRSKDLTFSRELVAEYIDETQKEVLGRNIFRFMETIEDTDYLSYGENEYELENYIQQIINFELTNESSTLNPTFVNYRDFSTYPRREEISRPSGYSFFGNKLLFRSPSDASYLINISYIKAPDTFTDSERQTPDIPEEFKYILIRGGLAGVEEYRENHDIAAVHRRKIEELANDMLLRYQLRVFNKLPKTTTRRFRNATN